MVWVGRALKDPIPTPLPRQGLLPPSQAGLGHPRDPGQPQLGVLLRFLTLNLPLLPSEGKEFASTS